ncbi:DNA-binding transcriptional MerR regulator/quercetin dioxygenase-like cupin family protein [Mesorhizobium soli]|uniref:MerR family transcriptional regulator n=1 Tax=Pseudaminobacter soli (ex Li et al. 2025) TaxID=1295366 RepID=UPI00247337AC|nr:MerR family transcriptional regulator [Mesorhizobium soli]MDH6233758.1 DNA-binding transcriptional MerR regulator/quercetin dioxygenase-like cupin family protein [Mesorhizobium soli]
MREEGGSRFRTVGEVATECGISAQTLRVWEAQGLVVPERSAGGHRLYSEEHVQRVHQIVELRRRHGWNPASIRTSLADTRDPGHGTRQWDGSTIRRARGDRGLTVRQAAERIGISPAFLSSIERGETGVSTAIISRIADAFLIPMSAMANFRATHPNVVRKDERARGIMSGQVIWEELALPGHNLEPALLTVPPGESSGGRYTRPGETFAFLLAGCLDFVVDEQAIKLEQGDSIILPKNTPHSWENSGDVPAQAIWVEQIADGAWAQLNVKRSR